MNTLEITTRPVGTLEVLARTTDDQILAAYQFAEEAAKKAGRIIAISGALLLEKKSSLNHGEWLPWLEANGIDLRLAQRHMQVATSAMDRLQIRHGVVFADLTFAQCISLPAEGLPELARKARDKFEHLTEGKTASQLLFGWEKEPHKPTGGAQVISFHCPHCQHSLKGKAGQKVHCPECHNPCKAKPDARDHTAGDRERIDEDLHRLADQLMHLHSNATGSAPNLSERALCSDEAWANLVRACQHISTFDKQEGERFRAALAKKRGNK